MPHVEARGPERRNKVTEDSPISIVSRAFRPSKKRAGMHGVIQSFHPLLAAVNWLGGNEGEQEEMR